MNARRATIAESDWIEVSKQVPCLACALFHEQPDTPAEYHHTDGQTKPNAHFKGFSLCEKHHRISDNRHPKSWISWHGDGKSLFEARYMVAGAFIAEQERRVAEIHSLTV